MTISDALGSTMIPDDEGAEHLVRYAWMLICFVVVRLPSMEQTFC